ncbi:type IV toxin-antitoxin system AbiEi family antitoxin domain-containing protein [Luteococcus sp. Sow4_B9]|uniref:type IV toxin-antitoxin system AbiEi family antitoxin domain-containing protein n=1 Tax=Luteococcus sp. Sow4_B9 TaxID=3438792 RepID=UPI003F99F4C0
MKTYAHHELIARGMTPADIRRNLAQGTLERLRRGDYLDLSQGPAPEYEERHRLLITATWPRLHSGVLSHHSAAALLGLPLPPDELNRVHITRPGRSGGLVRTTVQVHRAPLDRSEIVEVNGFPVTSLERTAVDLARTLSPDRGLAVVDAALRAHADPGTLQDILQSQKNMHGMPRARAVLGLGDGRAESAGESRSRWFMHDAGLPMPTLQLPIHDAHGRLLGRADFGWEELKVLGEFDGRIKYGRILKPGQELASVLQAEKEREHSFRGRGWWVHRWTTPEMADLTRWTATLWNVLRHGGLR